MSMDFLLSGDVNVDEEQLSEIERNINGLKTPICKLLSFIILFIYFLFTY
jgi:hypothetical protein